MTLYEEVTALQQLHWQQGYLVIGSLDPLPMGPIDFRIGSKDEAYHQARWRVLGASSRGEFEEQSRTLFGRDSRLPRMQYFYRVCALD